MLGNSVDDWNGDYVSNMLKTKMLTMAKSGELSLAKKSSLQPLNDGFK